MFLSKSSYFLEEKCTVQSFYFPKYTMSDLRYTCYRIKQFFVEINGNIGTSSFQILMNYLAYCVLLVKTRQHLNQILKRRTFGKL